MNHPLKIRLDHITTQYVWALENEEVFVDKARAQANKSNFGQFRRLVGSYILPARKMLNEEHSAGLSPGEWSYLYMEMWWKIRYGHCQPPEYPSYPPMQKSDEDDFGWHLERLNDAGYELVADRGVLPKQPPSSASPNQPSTPNFELIQEKPMSSQVIIQNKTLINGADVADMSDDQLINSIKKVEKEIDDLRAVKTKSKKIDARIEEATATLAKLVELLDAR